METARILKELKGRRTSKEKMTSQKELEIIDGAEEHLAERDDIEERFVDLCTDARGLIREYDITATVNPPASSETESRQSPHTIARDDDIQLPRLDLPKFSGSYENWPGFSDQFKSAVHKNARIDDCKRLTYLRSCLKGEAAKVVGSIPSTAANYTVAWDILRETFDKPHLIVRKHLDILFKLPAIQKPTYQALSKFAYTVDSHTKSVGMLKQPSADTLYIHLFEDKLDDETLLKWREHSRADSFPTLRKFVTFLHERRAFLTPRGDSDSSKPSASKSGNTRPARYEPRPRAIAFPAVFRNDCPVCKGPHYVGQCPKFEGTTADQRIALVKQAKLCLNCLKQYHPLASCRSGPCRRCGAQHHTILHKDAVSPDASIQANLIGMYASDVSRGLLTTIAVIITGRNGKEYQCRLLLDTGAQSHFLTIELARKLHLPWTRVNIPVKVIHGNGRTITHSVSATIKSRTSDFTTLINFLLLPSFNQTVPSHPIDRKQLQLPKNIKLADPRFDQPAPIDGIIGTQLFHKLLCIGKISRVDDTVALIKTRFGWIVTGETASGQAPSSTGCNLSLCDLDQRIAKLWEIEEFPQTRPLSAEELACERHFASKTRRDPASGRYVVRLPFKENKQYLGESHTTAFKRFKSLEHSFSRNPALRAEYTQFMAEYRELGHMSEVTDADRYDGYYLPHQAVFKQTSITTKVRVVFDAPSRSATGISLNETLMVGPTLQEDLFSILARFRSHKFVLTADIAKMYRQVLIDPRDRHYQKVLRRPQPTEPIRTYVLNTVTYGMGPSSFLAIRALQQLATDEGASEPAASAVMKRDFYVDDLLTGAPTIAEALELRDSLRRLTAKGGFELRQWSANTPELTQDLDHVTEDEFLRLDLDVPTKALGLSWSAKQDTILYRADLSDAPEPITKRVVLSQVARLFDPIGLLGPIVVKAKMLIQHLWQLKLGWDESLPADLRHGWLSYREQIPEINELRDAP